MSSTENKDEIVINKNTENNTEEQMEWIDYILTERENETFIDKITRNLMKFALCLQEIALKILSWIHWFSDHLFIISFGFTAILIAIAYIMQKLALF